MTVRCRATIAQPAPRIAAGEVVTARRPSSRTVQGIRYTVLDRGSLGEDARVAGPAIVEQEDSTVVVPPGWALRGAAGGALLLERA